MLNSQKQIIDFDLILESIEIEIEILTMCKIEAEKHVKCSDEEFSPFGGDRYSKMIEYGQALTARMDLYAHAQMVFEIMSSDMTKMKVIYKLQNQKKSILYKLKKLRKYEFDFLQA